MTATKNKRNLRDIISRHRARAFRVHGVPFSEFGRMTPAELLLLEKDLAAEQAQEVELENQRQAMLLAAIYNAPHFVPSKRLSPADFLPKKQASDEELAAKLYHLHAYHS